MSTITVGFIKCAMVYFLAAMLLGVYMSASGPIYPWMQIHVHFNLLGWISMMIYGVAYHILPRFSGRPLWSDRLSVWHIWLSNIGLVGMAAGWMMSASGTNVLVIFSVVEAISIIFFAFNMLKTVKAVPPPPKPVAAVK